MAALARLVRLEQDVRAGDVLPSPRARLLSQLTAVRDAVDRHCLCERVPPAMQTKHATPRAVAGEADETDEADSSALHTAYVRRSLQSAFAKCDRVGACLACTINPCICSQLPPLRIGRHDRIVLLLHCKEFLRTTNSGKLLLLAHPHATLLVPGLPEHDDELARICARPTACVLYPSPDAVPIARFRERFAHNEQPPDQKTGGSASPPPAAERPSRGGGETTADGAVAPGKRLDVIVLDGTWGQARHMGRRLPSSLPRVSISFEGVSLFGTAVRRQSLARQEAGRVSTVEAYAQCALELGDAPEEVAPLIDHLGTFIQALAPFSSRGCSAPSRTAVPASTDAPYRRRAFWLIKELSRGSWSEEGREALAEVLRQPAVHGRKVCWRLDADRAALCVDEGGELQELAAFQLADVLVPVHHEPKGS